MSLILFLCLATANLSPAFGDTEGIYKSRNSDEYVPCENGWYYFRNKCYRVAGRNLHEKFTWTRALNLCRRYGADLVSIQSQEEQNFVVAYLQLDVKWWAWIGLNDRDKEGEWKWSDGSAYNYSNWRENEPSGAAAQTRRDEEDCVHMIFEPENNAIGRWNDKSCDDTGYALCEMKANPRKRALNQKYCTKDESGGWRYGENSCYHIITEPMSWEKAERYCKNLHHNGHLLDFRDTLEDTFIELALPDIGKEFWIGIKMQDQFQQKWTSEWYVTYDRFNKDESFVENTCVARKSRTEWITIQCTEQLPFICEASDEDRSYFYPPKEISYCPMELDDWRDLGGKECYFIETAKNVNYYEANFDCQSRGASLTSIESDHVSNIFYEFVKYKGPIGLYIGLIRMKENNEETFGWVDGSDFDYENWAHGEPNSLDEKCVELSSYDMKWRDVPCDKKLSGYICTIDKIVSSSNTKKSSNCDTFCIAPESYLHGLISQYPEEANKVSCGDDDDDNDDDDD